MRQAASRERSSRHRPVSCSFCRSRKLRCSRIFPCDNCTTRNLTCQLYDPQPHVRTDKTKKPGTLSRPDEDVLSRLRRLEDIMMRMSRHTSPELRGANTSLPFVTRSHVKGRMESTVTDAEWLEREGMCQKSSNSIRPDPIFFSQTPLQQILASASHSTNQGPADMLGTPEFTKYIRLPPYKELKVILEKYLRDITYIHHVIHSPTVRVLVDELYRDLDRQTNTKLGSVALVLSILASVTYSWTSRDIGGLFSSVEEANGQAKVWIKATLDVLEHSRRTTSGSLEDIQAMLIVSFVVISLEGFTLVYRDLISSAITMARELSLHRIDHCSMASLNSAFKPGSVCTEIGRRVWWYLVATDWMFSRYAGPQEGVYTINPRHMAVNKPRNLNDEDLEEEKITSELPLSQPTVMSYFLQRIRLAESCRDFTDRTSLSDSAALSDLERTTHSQAMEVTARLDRFIAELPTFFRLDGGGELQELTKKYQERAPGIIIQRYVLNSLVYAQRCKLHMSYLARSSDPEYAASREICLHAARTIIRTEQLLEQEDLPFTPTRLKFSGFLYCIFMAVVVLLLDVCLNKDTLTTQEDVRKAEVVNAYNILEKARQHSTMATKLLESLLSVLRKHQVSLPGVDGSTKTKQMSFVENSHLSTTAMADNPNEATESNVFEAQDFANPEFSYFEEIWQSFGGDMQVDALFSDLNAQFL